MTSLLLLQLCGHRALHCPNPQLLHAVILLLVQFAATERYSIPILNPYLLCLHQLDNQFWLLLQFCSHRALPHPGSCALPVVLALARRPVVADAAVLPPQSVTSF